MTLSTLFTKFFRKYLRGSIIRHSDIHKTATICSGSNIVKIKMGRYSYCGYDCQISNTEIGSFCSISDHVYIGGAEHPTNWVSTSPAFENVPQSLPKTRFAKLDIPEPKKTIIGSDVWIGHGATVKQGVNIGHGVVIGSNALVTHDIPPYAIVGGVPAKIIKYRFDEETIALLLKSEWWKMKDYELQKYGATINEPAKFLAQINDKL